VPEGQHVVRVGRFAEERLDDLPHHLGLRRGQPWRRGRRARRAAIGGGRGLVRRLRDEAALQDVAVVLRVVGPDERRGPPQRALQVRAERLDAGVQRLQQLGLRVLRAAAAARGAVAAAGTAVVATGAFFRWQVRGGPSRLHV
jgi:hypothetical protein